MNWSTFSGKVLLVATDQASAVIPNPASTNATVVTLMPIFIKASIPLITLVFYSLLVFYMFIRLWIQSLQDAVYNPVKDSNDRHSGTVVYEKFCFVWSSGSAEFIAQVYPDILETWEELAHVWGTTKKATEMCEIRIHCTDLDQEACQQLVDELQTTSLFQEGAIRFGRPSIRDLVEKNTSDAMDSPTKTASRTLLAFCGSSAVGRKVKELKVMNDIFLLMSGNVLLGMDVVIQTYGVPSSYSGAEDAQLLQSTVHPFAVIPNEKYAEEKINFNSRGNKKGSVIHDDKSVATFENAYDRMAVKRRAISRKRSMSTEIVPMPELFFDIKKSGHFVNADISVVST